MRGLTPNANPQLNETDARENVHLRGAVLSVNGRTGAVTLVPEDIGAEGTLGNPSSDGFVLSSTAAGVRSWVSASLASLPSQTGNSGKFLGTNGTGAAWNSIAQSDVSGLSTALGAKAPLASPTFTGTVTIPSGAALGTPASLTLTNATGLPLSGVTNLTTSLAAKLAISSNLSDLASASTARANLGLGTAAILNTGTSGATIPLLSTANTWTTTQIGPFRDKGGAVYNVTAYGAVGDGVTDDGPAIQSLIDTVPLGSTVLIPSGTFLLNTITGLYYLLKLRDKVSVVGVGPSSILKAGPALRATNTGLAILYNHTDYVTDLQIADLTIDYNGANNLLLSGYGNNGHVNRTGGNIASGVTIRNVAFKNSAGHHFIWFGLTTDDARNDNNKVIGCSFREAGLSISGNQTNDHSSIYMGSTNSVIVGNSFINSTQDYVATAIELHGNATTVTGNTVLRYNHALNLGGDSYTVNTVAIIGNSFKSVVRGIVLWTLHDSVANADYTINGLTIIGNTITIVDTEGTAYPAGSGIAYNGNFDTSAATSSNWIIKGNTISAESVYTTTFAYPVTGMAINPVAGLVIEGNMISGLKGEGIRLESVTGKAHSGVVVATNNVQSCGYTSASGRNSGIYVGSNSATNLTTNTAVRGNLIVAGHVGSASDMAYGIRLNGGGQFEKFALEGNSIKGAVTFDISAPTNQTTTSKLFISHVAETTGTPLSTIRASWGSKWIDAAAGTVYDFRDTAGTNGNADGWSLIPNLLGGTNLVEQRNGANGQTFNLYNTFTNTSNYERGFMRWTGNNFVIGTEGLGTGVGTRTLLLQSGGSLQLSTAGVLKWIVNSAGTLVANLDNTYDIGASASARPRTGYFGTSVIIAGSPAVTTGDTGTVTDKMLASASKPAVALVATSNLTLSGAQTIDGTAGTVGQTIVLCTAQTTGSENGPWIIQTGAWTRPTWYTNASTTQAPQFLTTFVRLGTQYQGSTWRMTTASVTIGTTATTWVQTPTNLNSVIGTLSGSSVSGGTFGAVNGSALTALTAANISGSHTLPDGVLSTNVQLANGTLAFAGFGSITGTLGVVNGGNGLATATLGDLRYGSGTNTLAALSGNISTTPKVLRQVGNGSISAAPTWAQLPFSELSGRTTSAQLPLGAQIYDNAGTPKLAGDFNARILYDAAATASIDWDNRVLADDGGTEALNWIDKQLYGSWSVDDFSTSNLVVGSILQIGNQSAPSTPTSSGRIYFDASNRFSWIGTNGFTRTFDGTANTANRIYTLPDADSKFPVSSQFLTFSGPTAARTITLPDASFTAARTDAAQSFTAGAKLTLTASATTAGIAFGGVTSDPSSPANGDLWYRSDSEEIKYRGASSTRTVANLAGTQTLTNKTIDGGSNTLQNVNASSVTTGWTYLNAPVGVPFTVSVTGVSLTTAANTITSIFTVPAGKTFVCTGGYIVLTTVTGYNATNPVIGRLINTTSGSRLAIDSTTSSSFNAAGLSTAMTPSIGAGAATAAAGEGVGFKIINTQNTSTTITATIFATGFYY